MPLTAPGSLKPDEVYGLVAFLLWRNEIVTDTAVMNAQTLPRVVMPAHDRFVIDNRRGVPDVRFSDPGHLGFRYFFALPPAAPAGCPLRIPPNGATQADALAAP